MRCRQYHPTVRAIQQPVTHSGAGPRADLFTNVGTFSAQNPRRLALLRQGAEGWAGRPSRWRGEWWELERWQVGHRGNQVAITRAMASRAEMKLSWKWRSGREELRVGLSRPSGRGG